MSDQVLSWTEPKSIGETLTAVDADGHEHQYAFHGFDTKRSTMTFMDMTYSVPTDITINVNVMEIDA